MIKLAAVCPQWSMFAALSNKLHQLIKQHVLSRWVYGCIRQQPPYRNITLYFSVVFIWFDSSQAPSNFNSIPKHQPGSAKASSLCWRRWRRCWKSQGHPLRDAGGGGRMCLQSMNWRQESLVDSLGIIPWMIYHHPLKHFVQVIGYLHDDIMKPGWVSKSRCLWLPIDLEVGCLLEKRAEKATLNSHCPLHSDWSWLDGYIIIL